MYNSKNQYRCEFIRGRAIRDMDNMLPLYANIIERICPCSLETFKKEFDKRLIEYKHIDKKTAANHRTEVVKTLFGMIYEDEDIVFSSERTKKYLKDNDQPAFFKDFLLKIQFPSPVKKSQYYMKWIEDGISCHPYAILFSIMLKAYEEKIIINKDDLGYYILNAKDVLMGHAEPEEVWKEIKHNKSLSIQKKVSNEQHSSSYYQHLSEHLDYLAFANLLTINHDRTVEINPFEIETIKIFASQWNKPLDFDILKYDLNSVDGRRKMEQEWGRYYSRLSKFTDEIGTPITALLNSKNKNENTKCDTIDNEISTVQLGDEGEKYVYEMEKNRVAKYNPRFVGKVLLQGRQKGLGYDIQSVMANGDPERDEFVKYIEVKSTKRVTAPSLNGNWMDTLNITRNEWIAAKQHKDIYFIYRVYFTRDGVYVYILENPYKKSQEREITVVPTLYRIEFRSNAIDESYVEEKNNV